MIVYGILGFGMLLIMLWWWLFMRVVLLLFLYIFVVLSFVSCSVDSCGLIGLVFGLKSIWLGL